MGVERVVLGAASAVRSTLTDAFRFAVRFEGVTGAALRESCDLSLLYSLYFCAVLLLVPLQQSLTERVRTNFGVGLDVVASRLSAVVLGCKLLFPDL